MYYNNSCKDKAINKHKYNHGTNRAGRESKDKLDVGAKYVAKYTAKYIANYFL